MPRSTGYIRQYDSIDSANEGIRIECGDGLTEVITMRLVAPEPNERTYNGEVPDPTFYVLFKQWETTSKPDHSDRRPASGWDSLRPV